MVGKTVREQNFDDFYGHLPPDVQQRMRTMHPDDFDMMMSVSCDIVHDLSPHGHPAWALELVRSALVDDERRATSWRRIAGMALDMLILAQARARREEAGEEPLHGAVELPELAKISDPDERDLTDAMLRYRYRKVVEDFIEHPTSPYERRRRRRQEAEAKRSVLTVIDGGQGPE